MKPRYALFILSFGLSAVTGSVSAQCLGSLAVPAGQTQVNTGTWNPATIPSTISGNLPMSAVGAGNTVTVSSAAGLTIGCGVSGPNIPAGTTITGIAGTTLTLSNNVTGAPFTNIIHTFTTTAAYPNDYPPIGSVSPGLTTLNNNGACSICPALFTVNMCSGQYFRYQMCSGNIYTFSMCGAATAWNSVISVTNTANSALALPTQPSWNDDGCGNPGGHATISFTPTTTGAYLVHLWNNTCTANAGQCGTIQVACNPAPAPPSNDEPQNSVSLGATAPTACSMVSGTSAWATSSAGVPNNCLAGGCSTAAGSWSGNDVWFSVGIPASGNLSVILQDISQVSGAFAVYTGTPPGALTQISNSCTCSGFVSLSGLPAGTAYIRVWPQTGTNNMGTFQICAYEPIPPPNDNPCGSIASPYALPVGASCNSLTFTTENATGLAALYTAPAPSCGTPVAGGDVWFSAVMPATGSMTINTQSGTLTDMAMAVYTAPPGSITNCGSQGPVTLTQVICNDNYGTSTMPITTVSGAPNTTYYIRLWNKTAAFGTANICAIVNTPPPNDDPCGAIALQVNTGCYYPQPYSNQFASATGTTAAGVINIPAPSCGTPTSSDVWFSAVVPASGQLVLDMDDMQLTDAAFAVYTATGSCGGNNLSLTQVPAGNGGCAVSGSSNGVALPTSSVTGLTPGSTVYIRVWRQGGIDGTFLLCARNPQTPAGCYYTLRLADSAGDGWGGSYVTLCINGSCTNYTVFGSNANLIFSAPLGAVVTLTYTVNGAGFQNQVSYNLQASNGFNMFASSNPPSTPFGFTVNSDCNVPPAPISDCIGAFEVCNNQNINLAPGNFGNSQDLSPSNDGCLSYEHQGGWFRFTTNATGTIAFTIQVAANTDYDFAIWGPYSGAPPCPPSSNPIRCNWSGTWANTGLSTTALNASEGAGGPPWSSALPVLANQTYMLYIDNWTTNGLAFNLVWNNTPNTILDCLLPVEFMDFDAYPSPYDVTLKWSVASERGMERYDVERSLDGETFEVIGAVDAVGNSSTTLTYAFIDRAPHVGRNYYRLNQIDQAGLRSYSPLRSAVFRTLHGSLSVYPNPVGERLWASLEMATEGLAKWRILDASGRQVSAGSTALAAGAVQFEVPISVEPGSYVLEVQDEKGQLLGHARFVHR